MSALATAALFIEAGREDSVPVVSPSVGIWRGEPLTELERRLWDSNWKSRGIVGDWAISPFIEGFVLRRTVSYLDKDGNFNIDNSGNLFKGEKVSRSEHYKRLDLWYGRIIESVRKQEVRFYSQDIDTDTLRKKRKKKRYELRIQSNGKPFNGVDWYGQFHSSKRLHFGPIFTLDKRLRKYFSYGLMDRAFKNTIYHLLVNIGYDLNTVAGPYNVRLPSRIPR